jgi:cytolysin-activating lysine-acyltransferase
MLFGSRASTAGTAPPISPHEAQVGTRAAGSNGAGSGGGAAMGETGGEAVDEATARSHAAGAKKLAAAFGSVVSLMMRAPDVKSLPISELEWLVMPALSRGQFAIAEAQPKDAAVLMPIGLVLWAMVSKDVDARLSEQSGNLLKLAPEEWRSGDIPWITFRVGDPKVIGHLLSELTKSVFKGRAPRMRVRNADGKILVGRVEAKPSESA